MDWLPLDAGYKECLNSFCDMELESTGLNETTVTEQQL